MKDMETLDSMTLWDITANEGVLTMFVLGVTFLALSAVYAFITLYFKLKFWWRI